MTAIAGVVHKNNKHSEVWIGGDRAAVSGEHLDRRSTPKVFVKNDFLFGFSGSHRILQLIQYVHQAPAHPTGMEMMEYLVSLFVPSLIDLFQRQGHDPKSDDFGATFDASIMLGYRGRLFVIYSDFQVDESADEFCAIGIGKTAACAVLYDSRKEESPHARISRALSAAEHCCTGVIRPFDIEMISWG